MVPASCSCMVLVWVASPSRLSACTYCLTFICVNVVSNCLGFLAFNHESTVSQVEVFETVTFLVVIADSSHPSTMCQMYSYLWEAWGMCYFIANLSLSMTLVTNIIHYVTSKTWRQWECATSFNLLFGDSFCTSCNPPLPVSLKSHTKQCLCSPLHMGDIMSLAILFWGLLLKFALVCCGKLAQSCLLPTWCLLAAAAWC